MLVILFLACLNLGNVHPSSQDCKLIERCDKSTIRDHEEHDERRSRVIIPDQNQVASARSVVGIVPLVYNLSMTFYNLTYYTANATMLMDVKNNTDQIVINFKESTLKMDLMAITLQPQCYNQTILSENCIADILVEHEREALVIFLHQYLKPMHYKLHIPTFSPVESDDVDNRGKTGLLLSGYEDVGALSTQFLSGNVHYVIPCMNYLVLRMNFNLLADIPTSYTLVTSMDPSFDSKQDAGDMMKRRTLAFSSMYPVSLNRFGFSLLKGHVALTDPEPTGKTIWCPLQSVEHVRWMLRAENDAVAYLERAFTTGVATWRVDMVVLTPAPLISAGSLIFLSRTDTQSQYLRPTSRFALSRQLAHLWTGTRVSLKTWEEICLEEGLAAYFGYKFLANQTNYTVTEYIREALEKPRYVIYDSFRKLNIANEHEHDVCQYGIASLFQMISFRYDESTINAFALQLMIHYDYKSAGLNDWNRLLALAADDQDKIPGLLVKWYNEPGPVILNITVDQWRIVITQHLIRGAIKPRPIFLSYLVSFFAGNAVLHQLYFDQLQYSTTFGPTPRWLIFDPDSQLLAVKLYDPKTYSKLFNYLVYSKVPQITLDRLHDIARDFCFAVSKNFFDAPNDNQIRDWKAAVSAIVNVTNDYSCRCCLGAESKESYDKSGCADSRLLKAIR